jgi:hypothetical protein
MYNSNIKTSHHDWEKKNLVTISKNGKMYDEMVCKNCGMKGKRYGFEFVEVSNIYKERNVHLCPKARLVFLPKKIKITHCGAHGRSFENLLTGSIHEVVTPPQGYINDHTGVWVMGVGEPVKVLTSEFIKIE